MALLLRPSRIHAAGVFTTTPVRKGTRIVEYAGPRITPEEADRLYDGAPRTYLYGLEDGKTIIDGEGLGAYLNHSCDPNCEINEIKSRAWIFAVRDIAAGEELLWDYNLYDDDGPAPCHCGSPKCRGTCIPANGWPRCGARRARRKRSAEWCSESRHPLRLHSGKALAPPGKTRAFSVTPSLSCNGKLGSLDCAFALPSRPQMLVLGGQATIRRLLLPARA